MNKFVKFFAVAVIVLSSIGCARIETGEVGIRVNVSKEIQGTELVPGSWNQTIWGDVITFPVKDIAVHLENKTPLTADTSALSDFDLTIVYGINPTSVAELYSQKSKSFHALETDGDILLMYNYMSTLVNNAAYKSVREFKSLEVADNRAKIEENIRKIVTEQLKEEKLDSALTLNVVQVRNILPNKEIMQAATDFVRSQNELKIKENEVRLAKLEAERMSALANQSSQSIQYMNAQALLNISEGVKAGKVETIVVPFDFKGIVNANPK